MTVTSTRASRSGPSSIRRSRERRRPPGQPRARPVGDRASSRSTRAEQGGQHLALCLVEGQHRDGETEELVRGSGAGIARWSRTLGAHRDRPGHAGARAVPGGGAAHRGELPLSRARPYFDSNAFHRVVPNFVVQDGDPRGDGNGGPGYTIRDELNRLRYDRGALGMALSGPEHGRKPILLDALAAAASRRRLHDVRPDHRRAGETSRSPSCRGTRSTACASRSQQARARHGDRLGPAAARRASRPGRCARARPPSRRRARRRLPENRLRVRVQDPI